MFLGFFDLFPSTSYFSGCWCLLFSRVLATRPLSLIAAHSHSLPINLFRERERGRSGRVPTSPLHARRSTASIPRDASDRTKRHELILPASSPAWHAEMRQTLDPKFILAGGKRHHDDASIAGATLFQLVSFSSFPEQNVDSCDRLCLRTEIEHSKCRRALGRFNGQSVVRTCSRLVGETKNLLSHPD